MRGLAVVLVLAGCRFGGPSGLPEAPGGDAAPAGAEVAAVIDLAPPPVESDGGSAAGPDLAGVEAPPSACGAPFTPAVCDPVCNTGCPALSRCDVGAMPMTGTCVGIWISAEGTSCFKGSGTDACAPKLTCLSGRCRRLCYRDADCGAGTCCKETVFAGATASGFLVCGPC
jgi:hypothetical protein